MKMTYQEKSLALLILKTERENKAIMIRLIIEDHLLATKALPPDWRKEAEKIEEDSPGYPRVDPDQEQMGNAVI